MEGSSIQPRLRSRPSWAATLLPVVTLMVLSLYNGTADASTTSTSASCEGSGDGRCDSNSSENNNAACDFDGGDCCEYSCTDGDSFSCGEVGYTCLDPSAPEYVEDGDDDDESILASITDLIGLWGIFGIYIGFLCCWLMLCKKLSEDLVDRAREPGERRDQESRQSGFEDSNKKTGAHVFAWVLLAIELVVAIVLFLRGEGRVSKQVSVEDPEYPLLPDTCIEGEGPQWVSYAAFYRCGVPVVAQLYLWGLGEGLALPERAYLKAIVAIVARCTGNESWAVIFSTPAHWKMALVCVVSVHMFGPVLVDVMALCELEAFFGGWFFIALWMILFCNCTCIMAPGEGGLLHVVDAVFNGVLGTWANVVQSGFALGAVFMVLPVFEIVYCVAELFVGCC
ncbi:unnamed protein product [Ectocarpus sp. 13 AM-2016]